MRAHPADRAFRELVTERGRAAYWVSAHAADMRQSGRPPPSCRGRTELNYLRA